MFVGLGTLKAADYSDALLAVFEFPIIPIHLIVFLIYSDRVD